MTACPFLRERSDRSAWSATLLLALTGTLVHALAAPTPAAAYCAYVTHDDVVSVIDTASDTVAATILVGSAPFGVAATADGRFVYVANCGASCVGGAPSEDRISVIDTITNAIGELTTAVGHALTGC
jgi:YVTN family beta-propeller protein